MLNHLLEHIVTCEYGHRFAWTGGTANDKALVMDFSLQYEPSLITLTIWGPHNYVGVWIELPNDLPHLLCYHDSCWRGEIGRFFNQFKDIIHPRYTGCSNWYKGTILSDDRIKQLKQTIRDRDAQRYQIPNSIQDLYAFLEAKRKVKAWRK